MYKKKPTILYPVTIIKSRYGGTYSGGRWLAFHLTPSSNVFSQILGDDTTCCGFFTTNNIQYGKGETPDEALSDLTEQYE